MSKQELVRNLVEWLATVPRGPKLSKAFVDRFAGQTLQNVANLATTQGRFSCKELGTFRVIAYKERTFTAGFGDQGRKVHHRPAGQKIKFKPGPNLIVAAQT